MILRDMIQLSNNSRLTKEVAEKLKLELSEETLVDFKRWLKLAQQSNMNNSRKYYSSVDVIDEDAIKEWLAETVLDYIEELSLEDYNYVPEERSTRLEPGWDAYLENVDYEDSQVVEIPRREFISQFGGHDKEELKEIIEILKSIRNVKIEDEFEFEHAGSYFTTAKIKRVTVRGGKIMCYLTDIVTPDDDGFSETLLRNIEDGIESARDWDY
jgi:hypothetical protein